MQYNRIITIVMDSVGIGASHDAAHFGDEGANTLGHISEKTNLNLPNLAKMGLGNINYLETVPPNSEPSANYGKMIEVGDGKDTMTGHWEMMGVTLHTGFKQYTDNGFPRELIAEFEKETGKKVIGNHEASGMKVIAQYFDEHLKGDNLIVYTSVDSTFQIAAHEDIIPIQDLYKYCEIARKLTKNDKYNVARVIARPFKGTKDDFYRTANRHDYALKPFKETVMQKLIKAGYDSIAIGKISDIFDGVGVSESIKTKSNDDGVRQTINILQKDNIKGHIFVNLVDFDSMYGHPRDVKGYKNALEKFDNQIPEILSNLKQDDLLIITADHGNDPTFKGNDHTREMVPLIVFSKSLKGGNKISDRQSFEDLGSTICENFGLVLTDEGKSFLNELK